MYIYAYFLKWLKAEMAVFTLGIKKTSLCDVGAYVKMDNFYSSSVKTVAMCF